MPADKYNSVITSIISRNSLVYFTRIAAVNKEMYTDILWRIRDEVRRKRFEKWRTSSWLLLHDNAPAHRPVLIKDFLTKNNVTTLEHLPYSIVLTAAEFYLFHRLKSALKGWRFCDVTDIKNATEELKWFSQNSFQECVQHLYTRWQKCIFAQGDYFGRNVVIWF